MRSPSSTGQSAGSVLPASLGTPELVAHTADARWHACYTQLLKLLAQLADVAVHRSFEGVAFRKAVDQQFGPAEDPLGRLCQLGKQLELGECEVQPVALIGDRHEHLMVVQVDLQGIGAQHARLGVAARPGTAKPRSE